MDFVNLSRILSEAGIISILVVLVVVALFFVGYFLGSYLQRGRDNPNFAFDAHVQFDLHVGNLDKSEDDAKKSSEP